MAYQALYRIWRPRTFDDVLGQDVLVTSLTNQVLSGHVAHAYLFCGSRGTGKTSTAKVFARAINCERPTRSGPCDECASCQALATETNMDILEIDAASNNGVDEIRDLREKIKYPPALVRYRVYIIDEVHMLSTGAFNALLKTLEEPPSHAVFILATTEPQKLPATILSRCQRYDFKRIPARVIVAQLEKVLNAGGIGYEPSALADIARAAEGGMRDALSLLDMCLAYSTEQNVTQQVVRGVLGSSQRSFLSGFVDAMIDRDLSSCVAYIDRVMRDGREIPVFLREVSAHLRMLLLCQVVQGDASELLEISSEDEKALREQAARFTPAALLRALDLFLRAEGDIKWSSQPRTVAELCAARVVNPSWELDEQALHARLERVEQQLAQGIVALSAQAPEKPDSAPKRAPAGAKPAAQAASGAPAAPAEAGDDAARYEAAMKALRSQDMGLYACLSKARFVQATQEAAMIALAPEGAIYAAKLSTEASQAKLSQALSDAFGRPMRAQVSTDTPAKRAPDMETRKQLGEIYDIFGRDNVEVVDGPVE